MKLDVREVAGAVQLRVQGAIDEAAGRVLESARFPAGVRRIEIDAEQVEWINSLGAAAWMAFMQKLPAGAAVDLVRCAPCVVQYALAIPAFLERAAVRSFRVPYECVPCRRGGIALVETEQLARRMPQLACERCHGPVDLAVPLEDYLAAFGAEGKEGGA